MHKKRKRIGDLRGSASSTSSKTSKLKYAFLQPEDSSTITKSGQECHEPNGVFNAFTFMNFALAAATLGKEIKKTILLGLSVCPFVMKNTILYDCNFD